MPTIQTTYNNDVEKLYQDGAKILIDALSAHISKQDKVTFGICGGRSVSGIFKYLSKKENLEWSKVHLFLVDERVVPITDADSNFKLAGETLIDPLYGELLEEHVHPFIFDPTVPDKGASNYTKKINEYGNKFDVLLLSMGEDGHIGALYPNHHSVRDESLGYLYMSDSPKQPPERITATKNLIKNTDTVLLMAIGESKAEALKIFLSDGQDINECPARIVYQIPNRFLITDIK